MVLVGFVEFPWPIEISVLHFKEKLAPAVAEASQLLCVLVTIGLHVFKKLVESVVCLMNFVLRDRSEFIKPGFVSR